MAQVPLDGLDIIPDPERRHGERMSQIVQTGLRQANGLYDTLEVTIHGVRNQVMAQLIREHEVAQGIAFPAGASFQTPFGSYHSWWWEGRTCRPVPAPFGAVC